MDRLSALRGEAGGSGDSTLDTTSPPSEAFMSANDNSSKYFSLSDSTFDISPIKDVSLASAAPKAEQTITDPEELISNLSPISKADMLESYKIGKQIEAANILSGGVNIFDDNDNSFDGDELVIDDNVEIDDKTNSEKQEDNMGETVLTASEMDVPSKKTEVVLQIDGKNVDAIDIGNGLYLYRKDGQEELAAVQIIDDGQQQPTFKFLKVRENAEGNLEVYEEIEIEVSKEVPGKEGTPVEKNPSHVPIADINKVINEKSGIKEGERKKTPQKVSPLVTTTAESDTEVKELNADSKSEVNLNGKMMKFSESRKSPVVGSFTPMTYHSTPNKEGKPLTKTMVDQQLHPNRHSDNVKKTIEVHTDSKQKTTAENNMNSVQMTSNKDIEETAIVTDKDDKILASNDNNKEEPTIEASASAKDEITDKESSDVKETVELSPMKELKENENKEPALVTESVEEKEIGIPTKEILKESTELDSDNDKELIIESSPNENLVIEESNEQEIVLETKKESQAEKMKAASVESTSNVISEKEICKINPVKESEAESTSTAAENKEKTESQQEPIVLPVEEETIKNAPEISSTVTEKSTDIPEKPTTIIPEEITSVATEKYSTVVSKENKTVPDVETVVLEKCTEVVKEQSSASIAEKNTPTLPDRKNTTVTSEKVTSPVSENVTSFASEKKTSSIPEKPTAVIPENITTTLVPENLTKTLSEKNTILATEKVTKVPEKQSTIVPEKNVTTVPEKATKIVPEKVTKPPTEKITTPEPEKNTISAPDKNTTVTPEKVKTVEPVKNTQPPEKVTKTVTNKITNLVPEQNTTIISEKNTVIPENITIVAQEVTIKDDKDKPSNKTEEKKEILTPKLDTDVKPIKNNNAAVPFGKWTAANRQEFLNKFKECKAPVNTNSNSKQIKNSNDLNRRDVLKKIDSQRQSNIASSKDKVVLKNETIFSSKLPPAKPETKIPVKKDTIEVKPKIVEAAKVTVKEDQKQVVPVASSVATNKTVSSTTGGSRMSQTEVKPRSVSDIINKTIESMINKDVLGKVVIEEVKDDDDKEQAETQKEAKPTQQKPKETEKVHTKALDDIEMKMNELHGIPFVERPVHELPKVCKTEIKTHSKSEKENPQSKLSKKVEATPVTVPEKHVKEDIIDIDSDEEVIEHEPITGDININKKTVDSKLPRPDSKRPVEKDPIKNEAKKDSVITEKEFDKFARRNSVTYENCITVNYDTKEPSKPIPNVKDVTRFQANPKREVESHDNKSRLPHRQTLRQNTQKVAQKPGPEDPNNKVTQSKIHIAYQSVLTAKMDRQVRPGDRPITIIEDKPVKVVFMDANSDFSASQLNVQGQELSPNKKPELDSATVSTNDSVDSDMLDVIDEKQNDDTKTKIKHQRKQVLTPVEAPELELIQPSDLGISPKKRRKTEENKGDKQIKNLVHKKSYLLGRSITSDDKVTRDVSKVSPKEATKKDEVIEHKITASALDNLVKAAELIENQSENLNKSLTPNPDSPVNTPVKRGRGRPRKYPLPEGGAENKVPSPQKKPRLIDAKPVKDDSLSEDDSSGEDMLRENWTMGKINENIVCPICNKLFRSENVVFKHVKHCTGVSPNRSESDNRSPRRGRHSQESDLRSIDSRSDSEEKSNDSKKYTRRRRKSNDSVKNEPEKKEEVIVIEDTPVKEKVSKEEEKPKVPKKLTNPNPTKPSNRSNNLVCEFCGKMFRQLSYLVHHKLQHKREESKKPEKEDPAKLQVFSCEVCKKEFRKLHHLVQHRIIHNSNAMPSRTLRKSSSEQRETKNTKEQAVTKQIEDPSAAFRCEPCDKSFRKLHHLVEHRETHDGINRQKVVSNPPPVAEKTEKPEKPEKSEKPEKPSLPPQCDVCKKTFRKLHHLIEHKEQHIETSSEKSSDKSSLSTKDIIHECSLCYMVFPNEHSLNKHAVICARKKRQSKNKEPGDDGNKGEENSEVERLEDSNAPKIIAEEIIDDDDEDDEVLSQIEQKKTTEPVPTKIDEKPKVTEIKTPIEATVVEKEKSPPPAIVEKPAQKENDEKSKREPTEPPTLPAKREHPLTEINSTKEPPAIPDKIKKVEEKVKEKHTPKKKTSKDKVAAIVTKRQKTVDTPAAENTKPAVESSDDDDVRYMFNPNFKIDESTEGKTFMKVRANKRNSLQIERPNSKDLVKRRTSLQHPPKIPRLKPRLVENKEPKSNPVVTKPIHKVPKVETASTDSDDSDVKYSFPVVEKPVKPATPKESEKKAGRKSIAEKRKSLSGIAKRKSAGQAITAKHKAKASPKVVKKRAADAGHRCDCGQLFSSAALLARHASLAHTPPRIRRRRPASPPGKRHKTK